MNVDQHARISALFTAIINLVQDPDLLVARDGIGYDLHAGDVRLKLSIAAQPDNADGSSGGRAYEVLAFVGDTHILEVYPRLRDCATARAAGYMPRDAIDLCYRRLMGC